MQNVQSGFSLSLYIKANVTDSLLQATELRSMKIGKNILLITCVKTKKGFF